jgi:hypothetical protein
MVRALLAAAALAASVSPAAADDFSDLLSLQAVVSTAAVLAGGNHCAALELKPLMAATNGYLAASRPGGDAAATGGLLDETLRALAAARYDNVACDVPCPPAADLTSLERAPSGMAKYTLALKAVVDNYLERAESNPPVLTIASSRHSYDPLPLFRPGEPVSYHVEVGPSCHGAMLQLDRPYALPSGFEGNGTFLPGARGLWTIHLRRNDGVAPTPLLYLDAETGLRSYFKEFWVSEKPVAFIGPAGLGPFAPARQPIAPVPD